MMNLWNRKDFLLSWWRDSNCNTIGRYSVTREEGEHYGI